jgi:hypothetical protein
MTASTKTLGCFLLGFLIARPALADTIVFNNLGPNDSFDSSATVFGLLTEEESIPHRFSRAFPFVPASSGTLSRIELPIQFPLECEFACGDGSLVVNLFDAAGGAPGALLETFSTTESHLNPGVIGFSSAATPTLMAGGTYFVETTTTGGTNGLWFLSFDTPPQAVPDFRRNDGGPWEIGTRSFASAAFRVSVEPTPTPEPATLFMVGAGAVGVVLKGKRRPKRSS